MNAPSWLARMGIPEACIEAKSAAAERNRSFSLVPPVNRRVYRVKVDGCWITDSSRQRIDYLFCCEVAAGQWAVVLVELKGKDYGHALTQVEQTLTDLRPALDVIKPRSLDACIVLSNGNRVGAYQRDELRIRTRHRVKLHSRSRSYKLDLTR